MEHRHASYNVAKYFGMDYFAQAAGIMVSAVFFGLSLRGIVLVMRISSLPNLAIRGWCGSCGRPASAGRSPRCRIWCGRG